MSNYLFSGDLVSTDPESEWSCFKVKKSFKFGVKNKMQKQIIMLFDLDMQLVDEQDDKTSGVWADIEEEELSLLELGKILYDTGRNAYLILDGKPAYWFSSGENYIVITDNQGITRLVKL